VLVNLQFHPSLQKFTGVESHTLDVDSFKSLKEALVVLFPKLRVYVKQISLGVLKENLCLVTPSGKIITKTQYELDKIKDTNFTLIPIIAGGGGRKGSFLMVLVAIAIIIMAPELTTLLNESGGFYLTTQEVTAFGVKMLVSSLIQLVLAPPKPRTTTTSSEERINNNLFDAFENSTDTNSKVQFIYGMPRIAGQLLSGHTETISHDKNTVVYVSDLLYKNNAILTAEGQA